MADAVVFQFYKLVEIDLEDTNSEPNELNTTFKIKDFVPENEFPIRATYVVADKFLLIKYMKDCKAVCGNSLGRSAVSGIVR